MKPRCKSDRGKTCRIEYRDGFEDLLWKPLPESIDMGEGGDVDDPETDSPAIRVYRLYVEPLPSKNNGVKQ